jgi:hypothetical protein
MPELGGSRCVLCGKTIAGVSKGELCGACGCPVHSDCIGARKEAMADSSCARCGALDKDVGKYRVQARRKRRKSRRVLACGFLTLLLGLGIICLYLFLHDKGIEDELSIIEGVPEHARITLFEPRHRLSDVYYQVDFEINGTTIQYVSTMPANYGTPMRVLESSEPLKTWVWRGILGFAPPSLHRLEHRGKTILSSVRYFPGPAPSSEERDRELMALLIAGIALSGLGLISLTLLLGSRWRRRVSAGR